MATFSFKDKSVSATYFNMAYDNYYKTLLDIILKLSLKKTDKKGSPVTIDDMRDKKGAFIGDEKTDLILGDLVKIMDGKGDKLSLIAFIDNDSQLKLRKLLFAHFPILAPIIANEVHKKFDQTLNKKKSNVVDNEIHDARLSDCLKVLIKLGACLKDARNYFSHYDPYSTQEDLKLMFNQQKDVAKYLDQVFTASRRIDKKRKALRPAELQFITSEAYKALKDDNNHFILDEKGRKKIGKNRDYYFSIVGESFIHKEGEDYIQKVFDGKQIFTINKEENALSDFGLLYLCSCFISRQYTRLYAEQSGLFTLSPYSSKENNIILEMLSIYRVRLPKGKRLDIQDTKTSIALDMLNELNRCPKPLYEHLSNEDKKAFEDEIKKPNEKTPEVSIRLRHSDRFSTLALKMIDAAEILPTIRFHVQLGSYRFRFYDKDCIDGDQKLRCLSKEINGFGRLQDMEILRKKTWENTTPGEQEANKIQIKEYVPTALEDGETTLDLLQPIADKSDNNPYVTDHQATYNIHNNRIGLFWETSDQTKNNYLREQGLSYLPTLKCKMVERDGKMVEKADIIQPSPLCSLSTFDLSALLFYNHLFKKYYKDGMKLRTAEQIIIEKYNQLVKFFKEVETNGRDNFYKQIPGRKSEEELQDKLTSFGLTINEIPEKLRYYLRNLFRTSRVSFYASQQVGSRFCIVCKRLERFKEVKKQIGKQDNKFARKGYVDIRHGRLAVYLAQSIVDWLPINSKSRGFLTGLNFNKLQAALAMFDGTEGHQIADIKFILNQAHLLNQSFEGEGISKVTIDGHPFLSQVINTNPQDVEILYSRYLKFEKRHLIQMLGLNDNYTPTGKEQFSIICGIDMRAIPFARPDRDKWKKRDDEFCMSLAKRYQEHIELPDGLFTEETIKLLRFIPECRGLVDRNFNKENCNMSHLINVYLERVLQDRSQSFYGFKRAYDLFGILKRKDVRKELKPVYHSCEEIKDILGNTEGRSKISSEIDNYVDNLPNLNKEDVKTWNIIKEKKREFLKKEINHIKKNEKEIRRYKTQDIILFLTAKLVLTETYEAEKVNSHRGAGSNNQEVWLGQNRPNTTELIDDVGILAKKGLASMRLADIFDGEALNTCFPQEHTHTVSWKEWYEEKKCKIQSRDIVISQGDMAIKNYGRFYQLLSDKRFDELLILLIRYIESKDPNSNMKYKITYNDVVNDFTNFDHLRPEAFKGIHLLEREALPKLDIEKRQSKTSYSFKELMKELYSEDFADHIIAIRNAFAHGSYHGIDSKKLNNPVSDGESSDLVAPEVSTKMKEQIPSPANKKTK